MKIGLVVTDISSIGGCERVAVNMANELCNSYDITIISIFQRGLIPYSIDEKVNIYILQEGTERFRYKFINILFKMRKKAKCEKYDKLCFINSGSYVVSFGVIGVNVAKIGCEHTNLCNVYHTKSIMHKILRRCSTIFFDYIITLTDADKEEYIKKYKISNVERIYNWIPNEVINFSKKANMSNKKIISVGRFDRVKGYEMLVSIAKKVLDVHSDWEWHIYGNGDTNYREEIMRQIASNNLTEKLIIHDATSEIYEKYCESSILVLTSYYEGLPMVLLEGLALHLPMVAFDCKTGPGEIIENNITGYLIPCYDVLEMANKICKLIENETIREKMSDNCGRSVEKFSVKKIIQQWKDIFEKAL